MSATDILIDPKHIESWAKFKHAYAECSDEIQRGIDEMLVMIGDEDTEPDDRAMAISTVSEALYPYFRHGALGIDLDRSESMSQRREDEASEISEEMDSEEEAFAQRLGSLMKSHGMTQVQLAELSGVGQPAIANMLKRQCRPQNRTIRKFAKAFGVQPEDLWSAYCEE